MWQESEESSSNGSSSDDEKKEDKKERVSVSEKDEATRSPKEDSSSGKEESDSDYDEDDKKDVSDEDNKSDSSNSEKSEESESEASSDEDYKKKKKKAAPRRSGGKLDEETRKLLESENLLRRSNRSRPSRKDDSDDDEEEQSSSEWSEENLPKRKPARGKVTKKEKVKSTRGKTKKGQYKESSEDEEFNDSDVLEWEEEKAPAAVSNGVINETIERVIKSRVGSPNAVGSATTCYNVSERGDPNNGEKTEKQYLIKWVGWSHVHNTWESELSLKTANVNGMKKLQNFQKKQQEQQDLRRTMDKEYIEFFECEQVMNEDLCEEYKKVERIVAHQVSRDSAPDGSETTEFFVKWSGLPYSECTWEEQRLLPQQRIDEYYTRTKNQKNPHKSVVMKKRPKFMKIDEMPEYLTSSYNESVLRDYQLMGLNWMLHAWCKGNSCILADEMGLGKTIQSISFLAALFHRYDLYGPFLVVVPLSTMSAWQKEFQQWAPDMNLVTYMGDVSSRDMIRQYEWYIAGTKKLKVNAVLTTFEILLKDKSFLGGLQWAALLVDEAHRLKNEDSLLYKCLSTFHCDHRLLITGTPLQNSLKELWALLHFIMPEEFHSWPEFEIAYKDTDHKGISSLHKKLEPYLLRRVKKDVEKSLPAKVEQILRVDMTAQQKQYYKWILTKNYKELSKGVKGSISGFVNLCMELKKCCNHASLTRAYDYYEDDANARLQQLLKSSGKLILLDKLLVRLKETGHRVLIFSQMVMMLDVIQEYLQLRRFTSQRLDGSMRADLRKAALDHFNAEGSTDFCFLLSTRAGGLGINLATADTVIIFDSDWNPQNDLQAMSRAHRIGQTRKVNIYRLVTRASVEEQIVERAKQKLVLDHLVIQRMDTTGRTVLSKTPATGAVPFDKSELNDILKFGAAELFKEKEGEEQEPEVDIDRILMGAETRECEDSQANDSELLSAFKYANFAIDEEKDIAMAGEKKKKGGEGEEESWDDIIPEDDRKKIEEEERRKELEEMNLGPRVRTKVAEGVEEGEGGESESDESTGGGGRKKRRKAFGDFSLTEIKRFVRSFKKFARPLERLEAIAQDAELEEHSTEELRKMGEALLEGCNQTQEEWEREKKEGKKVKEEEEESKDKDKENKEEGGTKRDRGPLFKFATVDVYVRPLMKGHDELEPLHLALGAVSKESDFKVPSNTRNQKGWDVQWMGADDAALLRGVFKYGMGSWESIKMDPDLGLADKIFLKDKVKKPQPKHLQQRVDYLLKLLKTGKGRKERVEKKEKTVKEKDVKERKRKAEETTKKPEKKKLKDSQSQHHHHKEKEGGEKEKGGKSHHKKEKEKERENGHGGGSSSMVTEVDAILARIVIKKELYGHSVEDKDGAAFKQCVNDVKPVHKYLRKMSKDHSDKEDAKYLQRIGDSVRETVLKRATKSHSTKDVEKHYNQLWIFLSKFITQEPAEMLEKYRILSKHKKKHADVSSPKEKEKEKKERDHGNKREEKEKEKDRHHHHHHHHHREKEHSEQKSHPHHGQPLLPSPSQFKDSNNDGSSTVPPHTVSHQGGYHEDQQQRGREGSSWKGEGREGDTSREGTSWRRDDRERDNADSRDRDYRHSGASRDQQWNSEYRSNERGGGEYNRSPYKQQQWGGGGGGYHGERQGHGNHNRSYNDSSSSSRRFSNNPSPRTPQSSFRGRPDQSSSNNSAPYYRSPPKYPHSSRDPRALPPQPSTGGFNEYSTPPPALHQNTAVPKAS